MKNTVSVFSALVLIMLSACTKIKVERSGPNPGKIQGNTVTVQDTGSAIAGYRLGMNYFSVNRTLDISASAAPLDSQYADLFIDSIPAIRFLVLKDSIGSGVYVVVTDSTVKAGKDCANGKYAFGFEKELGYTTLCSENYDTGNYYSPVFVKTNQVLYAASGTTDVKNWTASGTGWGYFGFRFLRNGVVKYGWVQLSLVSKDSLRVIDYAYQK